MNPFTTEARIRARVDELHACRLRAGEELINLPRTHKYLGTSCMRRRRRELLALIRDCRNNEKALLRMTRARSTEREQRNAARSRGTVRLFA